MHWEYILPNVFHSICSLLCTTTNCTPYEHMFCYDKKSLNGVSLPSWEKPGPIYIKDLYQNNKSDLLVEEAKLLEANPQYAYVRLEDGREIPVSLRDLAPKAITSMEKTMSTIMMWQQNLHRMNKTELLAMIRKMTLIFL